MISERWDELSRRLAEALESPDPDLYISETGDAELAQALDLHRRSGTFLDDSTQVQRHRLLGHLVQGRYRLERVLGRGGAGVVFRATDEQTRRRVVIKILHDFWSTEDWMQRRFTEEAAFLAKLDHPGIVRLIDSGQTHEGQLFLVLPFHEGRTLRDALAQGPLDTAMVARLVREMGEAIHYAHQRGILHRDLKPENVLLVPRADGEHPLLIDFGIAQTFDGSESPRTTTHLMGSAAYMAPEQLMGKACVASDTYSLAVTAWEMLCGCLPFQCESPFAMLELQRRGTGDAFFRLRPDLVTAIGRLLTGAMSFDRARRPASIQAFTAPLSEALQAGTADSRIVRMWAIERTRRRVLAGGAATVAGVVAAGWALRGRMAGLPENERVVESTAGADAQMAGFRIHRQLVPNAIRRFPGGEVIAMRYTSPDQGQLHRPLTRRQKEQAFHRGWRLVSSLRPESGYSAVGLVVGDFAPRFDAGFNFVKNGLEIIATKGVRKGWDGIHAEVSLPSPPGLARLEMIYDAARKSATVLLDGKEIIRDYTGHMEYRDDLGPFLAVGSVDGSIGSAVFGGLRFEILA